MAVHKPQIDYVNGVSVLLPEIEDILNNSRISRKERATLTSIAYILKSIPPMRQDINTLKSNDWFGFLKARPKFSFLLIFSMYLFLISDVRYAVMEFVGEVLQAILKIV